MRKRFPGEMTVLGGFEMTSQTMRVSDPCYDRDVWCCGTFGKCKTGTWEAGVLKTDMGDWGVRCAVLAVRHKETGPDYSVIRQRKVYQMKDGWLEQPIDVGVDSGQAGFYDEAFYQDNSIFKGMPEPEQEINKGHCESDGCEFCSVNSAYDEIFNRFSDDEEDDADE